MEHTSDKNKTVHDMRSKLLVIMLYIDLLARDEGRDAKSRQKAIATIKDAAESMRVYLEQLS